MDFQNSFTDTLSNAFATGKQQKTLTQYKPLPGRRL